MTNAHRAPRGSVQREAALSDRVQAIVEFCRNNPNVPIPVAIDACRANGDDYVFVFGTQVDEPAHPDTRVYMRGDGPREVRCLPVASVFAMLVSVAYSHSVKPWFRRLIGRRSV